VRNSPLELETRNIHARAAPMFLEYIRQDYGDLVVSRHIKFIDLTSKTLSPLCHGSRSDVDCKDEHLENYHSISLLTQSLCEIAIELFPVHILPSGELWVEIRLPCRALPPCFFTLQLDREKMTRKLRWVHHVRR